MVGGATLCAVFAGLLLRGYKGGACEGIKRSTYLMTDRDQ